MTPKLHAIDHIHIHVSDRPASEQWYNRVLGLRRDNNPDSSVTGDGPLTLSNDEGSVHLALFESASDQRTVVAFATSGHEYMAWFAHLRKEGLQVSHVDHKVSWSVYFRDPDHNPYEITTYDYERVKQALERS
ncbi:VOC family protein [Marinobacter sp. X15-166B]|uniref:VOC family protein n=1 Tax=Marinobacter sp. X15-166B TaxID=1897620 RepID=UPI00085C6040|nr:VOC family protein [Marinobacter sp. X15-166B]OEY68086.1 hypothetical protein BG841_14415 [Marinobacter sp. X15-166B]